MQLRRCAAFAGWPTGEEAELATVPENLSMCPTVPPPNGGRRSGPSHVRVWGMVPLAERSGRGLPIGCCEGSWAELQRDTLAGPLPNSVAMQATGLQRSERRFDLLCGGDRLRRFAVQDDIEQPDPGRVVAVETPVLHELDAEFESLSVELVKFPERKLRLSRDGGGESRQHFGRRAPSILLKVLPDFLDGVHDVVLDLGRLNLG